MTGLRPEPIDIPGRPITHFLIKPGPGQSIRRVPLEDYVRAASLSEFAPPSGAMTVVERMLEVQAVIARTYAVSHLSRHRKEGFDFCSTTHCQLYEPARLKSSKWAAAAREASSRTTGVVLWHGSGAARAVFHADCGGHTSAASDIWSGNAPPYLIAQRDDGLAEQAHNSWMFEANRREMQTALNADPRTRVGRQLTGIRILARDDAGRATSVGITGTRSPLVRGEELRSVLVRAFGAKSVKSTRFQVERKGDRFVFTGRGYGHGVGLCQAGALAWLEAGARPDQVLSRYYPGTRLVVLR
jgi:stage II sporulation protein D